LIQISIQKLLGRISGWTHEDTSVFQSMCRGQTVDLQGLKEVSRASKTNQMSTGALVCTIKGSDVRGQSTFST